MKHFITTLSLHNHPALSDWHSQVLFGRKILSLVSQVALVIKNLPAKKETGFDPWVWKIPWKGKRQPTPVFLPGESHWQRSLVGYSPWSREEVDTTEHRENSQKWWEETPEFNRQRFLLRVQTPDKARALRAKGFLLFSFSHVWLSRVHGISQQEYWSGLPFPPPGDLPDSEIEPRSLKLAGRFFTMEPLGMYHT